MYPRHHLTTLFISKLSAAARSRLSEKWRLQETSVRAITHNEGYPVAQLLRTLYRPTSSPTTHTPQIPHPAIAGDGTGDERVAAPRVNRIEWLQQKGFDDRVQGLISLAKELGVVLPDTDRLSSREKGVVMELALVKDYYK
ncbi:hypothetical protein HYALB_00000522 [Hymenoscyphus albidus]|uniref:Uncharacterized protein n=1 Tax=Hymenoscyphus albidus TaxID=595503 RepID=A0A9N9Q801_9HELO|nr:hypothetical protein HYALB_00000522 [Hymenoscyphus albidus]